MKWWKSLYVQVLIAIGLGILVGWLNPEFGASLKWVGDLFINLIKMLIAPIIFTTVVGGFAGMKDLGKLGRIGWKSLLYFEVVSTLALLIGLGVAHALHPGDAIHPQVTQADKLKADDLTVQAHQQGVVPFLLNIIPTTFLSALTGDQVLQVLLVAVLFGIALAHLGAEGDRITSWLHDVAKVFFGMVKIVTRAAPVGAFGGMAYSVGKFGLGSLLSLGWLMAGVYLTSIAFVFVVLGFIARVCGFSIWKMIKLIREELLLVLGTSSSESALPSLMTKLQENGCSRSIVGAVIPAGYSFNLDGTSIYITMAVVFLAQATHTQLSFGQEAMILVVALLTSKGAAAVTGGGLITLTATLQATAAIPATSVAMVVGVDRFMSEIRALTNLIGNTLAAFVLCKWEGEFDPIKGSAVLISPPAEVPADVPDSVQGT